MTKLSSPKELKRIINQYGFRFNKSLGQNFLADENILHYIVSAANIDKQTGVIEIGPGIGVLTQILAENARKLIAIELDNNLIPILAETLKAYNNVKVINADVLKVNLNEIIEREFSNMKVKIVANLPYYITTPIIMNILERRLKIDSLVVMIQKEVAQRIVASPASKDYGALSIAVQYFAKPQIVKIVSPHCFIPQPKVESAVISMKMRDKPPVQLEDEKLFFKLIKAAFGQRRKILVNAIYNSGIFPLNKEDLRKIFLEIGIGENQRGEELSIDQFAQLTNKILLFSGK